MLILFFNYYLLISCAAVFISSQLAVHCVHPVMLEFCLLHVFNCSFYHLVLNIMFITNNCGYQSSQVAYTSTSSGMKNAGFPQNKCRLHFETTHTEQTEPQNITILSKHHIIQLKNTQQITLY